MTSVMETTKLYKLYLLIIFFKKRSCNFAFLTLLKITMHIIAIHIHLYEKRAIYQNKIIVSKMSFQKGEKKSLKKRFA